MTAARALMPDESEDKLEENTAATNKPVNLIITMIYK